MHFSILDPSDVQDVKQLFTKTFTDSEGRSEGELIGNLAYEIMTSTADEDYCGFVAKDNEQIIGCIIFSRLSFASEEKVLLLSPVAISTSWQRKGVGQKLINFGLSSLRENGVELVVTYGDPNYYSRVGFSRIDEEAIKAPLKLSFPEGWLGQSLVGDGIEPIAGNSCCIEALNRPDIW